MNMLNHYNPMLTAIRALCPTAHIGGGAVRDSLLGRQIKDVDVFLSDAAFGAAARLLRSEFGYAKTGGWVAGPGWVAASNGVVRSSSFERWDGDTPIQMIGLRPARDMATNCSRFDFGACMCAWNGTTTYLAPEFERDAANRTFTLTRAPDAKSFAVSMNRFARITKGRYADWTLVVPLRFKALERSCLRSNPHPHSDQDLYGTMSSYAAMNTTAPAGRRQFPEKDYQHA
jgi:hypothetical protein